MHTYTHTRLFFGMKGGSLLKHAFLAHRMHCMHGGRASNTQCICKEQKEMAHLIVRS